MLDLVELKSVCNIQSGGTPSRKKNSYYEGDIKWAKISDLETSGDGFIYDTEEKITSAGLENIRNRLFEVNTLLLAMYGSVGKTAITKSRMSCNQAILGITCKDTNLVDLGYLKYWFDSSKQRLLDSARGVALKNLSAGMVKDLKIPLPPLKTQKHIAQILDDAAALRDKTKQLLTEYDLLAQAIFLEMFGDPVSNSKGFEIKKLGDLGKWQSGGTPSRKIMEYYEGDIPWLSSGELNEMYISESKEHITEKALKESSTKLVPKGSLLLGMYDTAALKSTINTRDLTCNQAIAFGVLDPKLINIVYAYSIIQLGRDHYRRLQRGARQKNLNLSMVKGIKILYPSIHLQNQFAEKIALIEQQKELAKQELKESEDLFNCLLQKAFKGELIKD